MEDNKPPAQPVSEVPNPTTPVSDTPPVIPESPNTVIPGLTRNPETPKKFPLKLVIGIIIFLLLAGGAAASYVYKDQLVSMVAKPIPTPTVSISPTPTPPPAGGPTADWKTYSGQGYSIKYPGELFKSDKDLCPKRQDSNLELWVISKKLKEQTLPFCGANDFSAAIIIKQIPSYEDFFSIPESDEYRDVTLSEVTMNGIIGKQYTTIRNSKPSGAASLQFNKIILDIFEIKDRKVLISYGFDATVSDNQYNQILSTFKFTDSNKVDTSNWRPVKTKFLSLRIPKGNYIVNCGDELAHIVDWGNSDGEYCDFDGEQLITLIKDKKSYLKIDEAIPKSRISDEQVFTISDVKYFEIAGKKAASWKQIIKGVDGGAVPSGNRVEVYILPNISISFDPKVEASIQDYLSTITFTK